MENQTQQPKTDKKLLALLASQDAKSLLRSAGYSASEVLSAGYSASEVRSAGYSASSLRSAGYSASEVLSAGYSASEVRSAGYSASSLRSAGYSASSLRSAGYSASEVLSAGYSASEVLSAGYSASEVLSAGYSASEVLSAGYSASEVRSAGYSASSLLSAGYSASEVLSAGYSEEDLQEWENIPVLDKPYTKLWNDLQEGKRTHNQAKWCDGDPETNLCGTPMCTAGHLVHMAGAAGRALKEKYDWPTAAGLIHYKAHPDYPCQNFGMIPQEHALAYIEVMAEREAAEEAK